MAFRTASLAGNNSTDALFRLWINEIHNALVAFGWVQTADTGQVNYATVTRPAAINTYQGYAVYRMADSLQATCAVFIRLDYGTGGTTDAPAIKVKVAIGGTDGAGTLTGLMTTQQTLNPTSTWAAANMRTAGSTSSFRLSWGVVESQANSFTFAIERDNDTSGNETALGVNFLANNSGTTSTVSQFLETAGGISAVEVKWYAMISIQASQSGGGTVGVAPVRIPLGPFRNPMKTVLIFAKADFTTNTTNPVTIYGVSHTYLMLCPSGSISLNVWNAACGMAFLWE